MTSYNITQDVAVIVFEAYGFAGCQNPGKGRSPSLSANKQSESAVTHKVTADFIYIPYKNPYKFKSKPRPIQR